MLIGKACRDFREPVFPVKIKEYRILLAGNLIDESVSVIRGDGCTVGIKKNIQVFSPGFQIPESTVALIGSLSFNIFFGIKPPEELVNLLGLCIKHRLIAGE